MVDERAHFAERLQSDVIQRVSRLGVDRQGLAVRSSDPQLAAVIQSKVDDVDAALRALRAAIAPLRDE
jgi:uncharacterized Fe-S cluster-containing radical SAM superfamily enzyme